MPLINPCFRAGSTPENPTAVSGPFKASLTGVFLAPDKHPGKRRAYFSFTMLAEPKWSDELIVGRPVLVCATDDRGAVYKPDETGRAGPDSWSKQYENFAVFQSSTSLDMNGLSFDDGMKALVSADASFVVKLSFEVPVRLVRTELQCRFEGLKPGSAPRPVKAKEVVCTVKEFGSSPELCDLIVEISGKNFECCDDLYRCWLEKAGSIIRSLNPSFNGSCDTHREARMSWRPGRIDYTDGVDLVIAFPDESIVKKVRFDFENVRLP